MSLMPIHKGKQLSSIVTHFSSFSHSLFRSTQKHVHQIVIFLQEKAEIPGLILRVCNFSITVFSLHPAWAISLKECRHQIKEIKNIFNWIKGLRSIDGFLNGPYSWKSMVIHVSGFVLLILSTISLVDWLHLANMSVLKTAFAALPILGVLPFGGLVSLSLVGIFGMLLLLNLEKRPKMALALQKAQNKNQQWLQSLKTDKVNKAFLTEQEKISYQTLKQRKWTTRLKKLQKEEKLANQAAVGYIINISKQILFVATVFSGWGTLAMIGIGLDGIDGILAYSQFFKKRSLKVLSHQETTCKRELTLWQR